MSKHIKATKKMLDYWERHIDQYLDAEDVTRTGKKKLKNRECFMCKAVGNVKAVMPYTNSTDSNVSFFESIANCNNCPLSCYQQNRETEKIIRQKVDCRAFRSKDGDYILDDSWGIDFSLAYATIPEIRAKRDHIRNQIKKYTDYEMWIPKRYEK